MGLLEEFARKFADDALLRTICSDRWDTYRVQQGRKRPYGVLYELITEPVHGLGGESGVSRTTLQVDVWCDGADGMIQARRAGYRIRDLFKNNFRGQLVEGGTHIESIEVRRLDTTGQRPEDGSDNYIYRASLDLEVIHEDLTADTAA